MNFINAYTLSGHFSSNMLLYGCGVSAFSVGQLTVGWRDGKARERGMCDSISSRALLCKANWHTTNLYRRLTRF
ncbi:MAG: hypothetical protein ACK47E_09345 [Cyclobacteriaceae bacterium]